MVKLFKEIKYRSFRRNIILKNIAYKWIKSFKWLLVESKWNMSLFLLLSPTLLMFLFHWVKFFLGFWLLIFIEFLWDCSSRSNYYGYSYNLNNLQFSCLISMAWSYSTFPSQYSGSFCGGLCCNNNRAVVYDKISFSLPERSNSFSVSHNDFYFFLNVFCISL